MHDTDMTSAADDGLPPDGNEGLQVISQGASQLFRYFNQGTVWFPNGKPRVQITDMDPAWRHNAAAFLVRNARHYLVGYEFGEFMSIFNGPLSPTPDSMASDAVERGLDDAHAEREANAEAWIKSTPLYRALVDGLPENAAELAKHWSDCAIRTDGGECTCWERHLAECPKRADINERCCCRDYDPEWTL